MSQVYIHLERISIEEATAAILANLEMRVKKERVPLGMKGYMVHVTGVRLRTFGVKGTTCYICGNKATHFSIDVQTPGEKPHLNLWGVKENGDPLLFTHDHVLARSLGGGKTIKNTEPCCTDCNFEKSKYESVELARRHAVKKLAQRVQL
jgi:hypothetical protein